MKKTIWLAIALAGLVAGLVAAGCSEGPEKNGSACDVNTVCDGICLLGMPDGLCTSICTVLPCGANEVCTWIAGNDYCLPACEANEDCRTGYACVLGVCRPPGGVGVVCEEDADCESGLCAAGLCSADCTTHADCPESLYCDDPGDGSMVCLADDCSSGVCLRWCTGHEDCAEGTYCLETETDGLRCAPIPDDGGQGTLGHNCSELPCVSPFVCHTRFDGDMQAYCTKDCSVASDCAPGMICQADATGTKRCLHRQFCDSCAFDGQCGFGVEKCVAADAAVSPGDAYCSTACDFEANNPGCPPDSECMEASFCVDSGTWVADCAECTGTCGPVGAATYQCFHTAGACASGGGSCTPCIEASDCTSGVCLDVIGLQFFGESNRICTEPCTAGVCPDGFFCYPVDGQDDQCIPRSGECSETSDGGQECDYCNWYANGLFNPFKGCEAGLCVEFEGVDRCFNQCDPGMADCPAYSTCGTESYYGGNWNVCVPTLTCLQYSQCIVQCPTGPASCGGGAPAYCL